ncbi:MAG: CoA-binding protein [Flavobacteriaceae bacterium]
MVESFKTLVLGASLKPERYSYKAIELLKQNNMPVVAVGLRPGFVSGVKIDTEPKYFEHIHTVTLYLNPKRQESFVDYILMLNPKRVIFNPGTENPVFYKILEQHHISYEIACTLVLLSTYQYQPYEG